jgi:ATP-binding cassette subfamily B (MDR/TAP) protein 1
MSLVFEPQKSTALIGPSGGGKSTIMDLLDRWIEPSQGNIYLDGTNIKDLDMKWYRSQIRVVEQEPRLFDDTIFRNVADGLSLKGTDQGFLPKEFIRALVRQACREANIHSFIETLPQGYDTRVGEQGNRLSGGQKQRIAIARAIVSNPRILLLDEATSALDDQSERLVQEALKNISKYRTTITIAHKLSTIQNADQILVIDQGRLIEQGNHEELLWFNGLYKSLFQSQYLTKRLNSLAESGELMYTPEEPIKKDLMTKEGLLVTQEEDLNKKSEELEPAEAAHLIAGRSLFRCLWIIFKSQRQLQILLVPGIIAW